MRKLSDDGNIKEGFKKILFYSLDQTKKNIITEQNKYEKKFGKITLSRKITIEGYTELFKENYNDIINDFFEKNSKLIKNKNKIVLSMFVFSDKYGKIKSIGKIRASGGIYPSDVLGSLHLVSISKPKNWILNNCFYFQIGDGQTVEIITKKKEKGLQHNLLTTNKIKNEYFIGSDNPVKDYLSNEFISRILWYNEIKIPDINFQINVYVTEKKIQGLKYNKNMLSLRKNNVFDRLTKQKRGRIINEINKHSNCYLNYGNKGRNNPKKYIDKYNNIFEVDNDNKVTSKGRIYDQTRTEKKCECHVNEENTEKCKIKVKKIYSDNFCKEKKKYYYKDSFLELGNHQIIEPDWTVNKRHLSCEEKSDFVLFHNNDYPLKITEEEINNSITCKKVQSKTKKLSTILVKPLSNTRNFLIRIKSVSLIVKIGLFLYQNKDKIKNIVTVVKPLVSWWLIDNKDREAEIEKRIVNTKALFRLNEMVDDNKKISSKVSNIITNAMYVDLIHEIYKKALEKKKEMHIIISSKNLVKVNEMVNNALLNNKVIIYFCLEDFKNIEVLLKMIRLYIKQKIKAVTGNLSFIEESKKVKNLLNVPLPLILSKTYKKDGKSKFNFSVGKDKI